MIDLVRFGMIRANLMVGSVSREMLYHLFRTRMMI